MMNNNMPRCSDGGFIPREPSAVMPPMTRRFDAAPGRALAMAYVEWQTWQNVYPAEVGFERGTIFEDLDFPFIGEEAACND